ncbi:hypothetical protein C8R47DRAFT_1207833 [Mycena vitilis]|nr:hypothetical protein C8R47DRAFT_1207833 [Mycena vitilis]
MRFAIFFLPALYAAAAQAAVITRVTDQQLLVKIPSVDGASAFKKFTDVCTLWPPFQNIAGLSLKTLNIVAGDFSGLNQNTEAIVICTWTDGTNLKPITQDVVSFIGATTLSQS